MAGLTRSGPGESVRCLLVCVQDVCVASVSRPVLCCGGGDRSVCDGGRRARIPTAGGGPGSRASGLARWRRVRCSTMYSRVIASQGGWHRVSDGRTALYTAAEPTAGSRALLLPCLRGWILGAACCILPRPTTHGQLRPARLRECIGPVLSVFGWRPRRPLPSN